MKTVVDLVGGFFYGIFSCAVCLCTLESVAFAQSGDVGWLPAVLERAVSKNNGHGGGVFRVSDANGLVWEGTGGYVDGCGSARMEPRTPFEVASITKMVTAATVLKLVEDGKLRLDCQLIKILPAGQAKGFDGDITVQQLLSHTSGLPDYWTDVPRNFGGRNAFLRAFLAEPDRRWDPEEILEYAQELRAQPRGRKFHYSDTNYVLLGLIIEHVTGQPLHRVFREMIFNPMGMQNTWLSYREEAHGSAPSHRFEGTDDLHGVARQSADWAGGGLVSTTHDLERLLRGMATGSLFKNRDTLDAMRKAVPTGEDGISYGMGIYRVDLGQGRGEIWGHDGHGNSFAYYWPERGLFFTGTLNQTKNDWWPLLEAFIAEEKNIHVPLGENKLFDAVLSAGWDSLYMFRGVNALRNDGPYGSGIAWADLNVIWNITPNDNFSLDVWQAFSTQGNVYKETDIALTYSRSLGSLTLGCGYAFFYGYAPGNFSSNELVIISAYELSLGPLTLIPSLDYFFHIGPGSDDGNGSAKAASSFLLLRVDASLPIFRDIIALEPWGAFGVNFQYNTKSDIDGEPMPFTGSNNLEMGLAVPIKINDVLTVSGYVAYSRALTSLSETSPNTFWGGGSVSFSF